MAGALDHEYAIWVSRDELGEKKQIHLDGKAVSFRVPDHIDGHVVLRLKGLGYRSGTQTGNLLVRINLMEDDHGREGMPFRRTSTGSSPGGGFGPFSRMYRTPDQEAGSGQENPLLRKEAVNDPVRVRRSGYLITGAGLVLMAGGFFGILPPSAWAGAIIVAAGIYISFFS